MTMKKIILAFVLGLFCMAKSEAAGAKTATAVNYSVTVTSITVGPAALYAIVLSTPTTAGDYVVVWDSATGAGLATNVVTTQKLRVVASTTAVTFPVITFDPPIKFRNGIMAALNAATNYATFIWESGSVVADE
jgi:hypothetical protein